MNLSWSEIIKAISEWFKPKPEPKPKPDPPKPIPDPPKPEPPESEPTPEPGAVVVWDGALIGQWMDAKGWYGEETEQWYALFSSYGSHEWGYVGDRPTAVNLWNNRENIKQWFTDHVARIGEQLLKDLQLKVQLIDRDANDLGGCFMWQPIKGQLLNMGIQNDRIEIGEVY